MKITFLLFFILSFSSSLLARIGETKDQCRARYGEELGPLADIQQLLFNKNKMTVRCFFTDDVCDYIIYCSTEADPATAHLPMAYSKPRLLTDVEIQTLLEANGVGWKKGNLSGYDFSWETGPVPKPLIAGYRLKTRVLEIVTSERLEKEIEKVRLKEKSKLNGF